MTCMATPEQTCIVQVILEHEEAFNLRQHRRNETMLKKRILDFIHQLRQRLSLIHISEPTRRS